jgi:hypothetical protein
MNTYSLALPQSVSSQVFTPSNGTGRASLMCGGNRMSRASEATLNNLHEVLANQLISEINKYANGEYKKDEVPIPVPASLLSTAAKYLNDNQINRPEDEEPDPEDLLSAELPNFGDE